MSGPIPDPGAARLSASDDVRLEPVTAETVRAVCDLTVSPDQEHFVTANAVSLAEASFHPQAWHRAVYAGDELVGFVMLHDAPTGPGYMLWRLMIGRRHQGRGVRAPGRPARRRPRPDQARRPDPRGRRPPWDRRTAALLRVARLRTHR